MVVSGLDKGKLMVDAAGLDEVRKVVLAYSSGLGICGLDPGIDPESTRPVRPFVDRITRKSVLAGVDPARGQSGCPKSSAKTVNFIFVNRAVGSNHIPSVLRSPRYTHRDGMGTTSDRTNAGKIQFHRTRRSNLVCSSKSASPHIASPRGRSDRCLRCLVSG
jgi:hypothetical protein